MKKLHAEKTLEERLEDSEGMLKRYPGRCCIYVEKMEGCKSLEELPKKRFLLPENIPTDQFMCIVRKRLSLKSEEALFFYIKKRMITGDKDIGELYHKYKQSDNFLYIKYSKENCFG